MKRAMFYPLAIGVLSVVASVRGSAEEQEPRIPIETRNFMRAKLEHSQKILEGLTTENFEMVAKNAQDLSLLSLESHWNVLRTKEYVDQSAEFRHTLNRLVEAANEKKMDTAALSYVDVMLKCIHCHKYVRDKGANEAIGLDGRPRESRAGSNVVGN